MTKQVTELRHPLDCPRFFDSLFERNAAHDVLMSVFFHRNARYRFLLDCLSIRNRLHFHEVVIHGDGGPPRLILAFFIVLHRGPHHGMCSPVSERYACCFVLLSPLTGPCPHTPIWRCQFFYTIDSVSLFIWHFISSFYNSIQFCFFISFQFSVFQEREEVTDIARHVEIKCFLQHFENAGSSERTASAEKRTRKQ